MSARMRQLEGALRELQTSVSDTPHPLLQKDLELPQSTQPTPTPPTASRSQSQQLQSENPSVCSSSDENPTSSTSSQPMQVDQDVDAVDSCGTLMSTSYGEYIYIGSTARPEYLMHISSQPQQAPTPSQLPKRIVDRTFFDADLHDMDENLGQEIYQYLPPLAEARGLCELYLDQGSYLYTSVLPRVLNDEVLASVYQAGSFEALRDRDSLPLLFIIFSLATLFNIDEGPNSGRAYDYFCLSRAALSFFQPSRGVTLNAVQAVIHMAQYLDYSNIEMLHSNSVLAYVTYAVTLGHQIGLHLNDIRWNLPDERTLRRCKMFWQLFELDTWTSFYYARPLGMSPPFIDCPFPKDVPSEHATMSFGLWNGKYASLVHSIITITSGPKPVPYSMIVDLDRRVRDFYVPSLWQIRREDETPKPSHDLRLRRWLVSTRKEIVLLNIHRPYLVQVLSETQTNFAKHRYQVSVIACFRSAWRLIHGLKVTWEHEPQRLSRMGLAWSQCLSAAVVFSLLASRAPKSAMTSSALHELDAAVQLFEQAAPVCQSAANLETIVLKLQRTAKWRAVPSPMSNTGSQNLDIYSYEELERFAGKTTHIHHVAPLQTPPLFNTQSTHQTDSTSAGQQLPSNYLEEDPFQVLTLMTAQRYQQSLQPLPVLHGLECMHETLEQDLRDLGLGRPGINLSINSLFDPPSTRTHQFVMSPTVSVSQPMVASTSGTSHDSDDNRLNTTSDAGDNAISGMQGFNENAFISNAVGCGLSMSNYSGVGQSDYFSPQACSSLNGDGLISLEPSLQSVAEHLGFFNNSLCHSNSYFTSLTY
ncbi:hypothetical protein AX17_000182 [Amanita inopinata Kibby_2008]|nr:hypothetical protein AX17_000182 [Amanita inopinata Kibby_2008]